MKTFFSALILILALTPGLASVQQPPSLEQIIDKTVVAMGGLKALHEVKSQRVTGRISFGDGGGPLIVELKRPGKMRMELNMGEGRMLIRAYDGTAGWQINPFLENKGAQAMSATESNNIAQEADFEGPLVDWARKGHQVELVGKEQVDGRDAYKIKVTLHGSGYVDYYYFDGQSYRKVKWEGHRTVNGQPVVFQSTFSDYRNVGGLTIAFRIESTTVGTDQKQEIVTERIDLNLPLDDARFMLPPGK